MTLFDSLMDVDIYPCRGTFRPGEEICLIFEGSSLTEQTLEVDFLVIKGVEQIHQNHLQMTLPKGYFSQRFSWQPSAENAAGYGAELRLKETTASASKSTRKFQAAFDVLPSWTVNPRYGFLCNFDPNRTDITATIKSLVKFHINGLQFYDWQFRHDRLLATSEIYIDPLGRTLSLNTIKALIEEAHNCGIAAMPYLAVYGASWDFWNEHREWGLYEAEGKPILFGEHFLGIMNPVKEGKWQKHLLDEESAVLKALPFDGLHIDQYGEPKSGFDDRGNPVDLPRAFGDFLRNTADRNPQKTLVFNAVGNWPIETLAQSPVAFNYIEIWPPDVRYLDLARIVRNAKELSNGKPVVIALYLHADQRANNLLADAVIMAAGGTRIELGEQSRLLADPYFPKYEVLSDELENRLRIFSDFYVRFQDWLLPSVAEGSEMVRKLPNGVIPFLRQVRGGWSLCLVNQTDPSALRWDKPHDEPAAVRNFEVCLDLPAGTSRVWQVSPDQNELTPLPLEFSVQESTIKFIVPELRNLTLLFIETDA